MFLFYFIKYNHLNVFQVNNSSYWNKICFSSAPVPCNRMEIDQTKKKNKTETTRNRKWNRPNLKIAHDKTKLYPTIMISVPEIVTYNKTKPFDEITIVCNVNKRLAFSVGVFFFLYFLSTSIFALIPFILSSSALHAA